MKLLPEGFVKQFLLGVWNGMGKAPRRSAAEKARRPKWREKGKGRRR